MILGILITYFIFYILASSLLGDKKSNEDYLDNYFD